MIVWLVAYPRSGITLARTILNQTMGIKSFSDSSPEFIHEYMTETTRNTIGALKYSQSWKSFYREALISDEVYVIKSHDFPRDDQPAIHIVRDGRMAYLSYSHFHRSFTQPPCPSLIDIVLGADHFGGWAEHYRAWQERGNTFLIRFEDLLNPADNLLKKLSEIVKYSNNIAPWKNPFEGLHHEDPGFFREGHADWKRDPLWTYAVNAIFFHLNGDVMSELGYADSKTVAEAQMSIPDGWLEFIESSQRLLIEKRKLDAICVEKESMIASLKQICDERECLIEQLSKNNYLLEQRKNISAGNLDALKAMQTELKSHKSSSDPLKVSGAIEDQSALLMHICDVMLRLAEQQQETLHIFQRYAFSYRLDQIRQRHRYPKLGNLFHHESIPMERWGFPRKRHRSGSLSNLPDISVVTPSLNQSSFIGRTIASIIDQRYPNLEYFVQDGGSNDGTIDILKDFADRLSGWDSMPDTGQGHAINQGFAKTRGAIMAWINSDDLLLPGALEYVGSFFADHADVDVIYGSRILIDKFDREIGRWILPKHDDDILSWADYIPQETLFWRRSIWDQVGGYIDDSFKFAIDWDLLLRFRKAGARFVCLPRFLGGFRVHPAQKTKAANKVGLEETKKIRLRELGYLPTRKDISNAIKPYLRRHMIADIAWRLRRRIGMD